jgi:ribA/ribD-fused uncharacterized protein
MTDRIDSFSGRYRFLSNFYVEDTGLTVEHHFQAAKTKDINWKARILTAATPGEAKRLGREASLRPDWEAIKVPIMQSLLIAKFMDEILAIKLIKTGDAHLEEGNTWGDTFWGTVDGRGNNMLGKLLMEVRKLVQNIDNW